MGKYLYFEWEDRVYRGVCWFPLTMDIWVKAHWEPYQGDAARVLMEATHLASPPRGVQP